MVNLTLVTDQLCYLQGCKLYSKFVLGHCFELKLTFFCNGFILSNISSLI